MNLTEQQFDKRLQELIKNIRAKTTVFKDNSPSDIDKRKEAGRDFLTFAKTYFPHYIEKPFGKFHRAIHDITEAKGQIIAVAGPHKFGKSVLLAVIKPIWRDLYGISNFIPVVSASETDATERTIAIRCEYLYNKRIINDFGEQLNLTAGSESDFITKNNCRYLARGYKQKIRGMLHGPYRADYIVVDDYEDIHSRNSKIAAEKLEYIREEVFTALDDTKGSVIWLGNLTSKQTAFWLCKELVEKSEEFLGIQFCIFKAENQGKPLWPEGGYTIQKLEELKKTLGRVGYQRRMLMEPVTEGLKFKTDWFRYYNLSDIPNDTRLITCCDPSWSKKGDFKAIITVGFWNRLYHLVDIWIRKTSIDTMFHYLYELDRRFNTRMSMESTFAQTVLWEFLKPLSDEYKYILPLGAYSSNMPKEQRIEKLEPLYERGNIIHPLPRSADLETLEEQLTHFPELKHDDGPDVLSACIDQIKIFNQPFTYHPIKRSFRKMPS